MIPGGSELDLERDRDARVWRYLDPLKLISILHHKALFFARLDFLGDSHEAALGRPNAERLLHGLAADPDRDAVAKAVEVYNASRKKRLAAYAASCWHMSEIESAAMWSMYAPRGLGIAVQSTVGRLNQALQGCHRDTYIARVKYVDYETQEVTEGDALFAASLKRREFSHERELRVFTPLDVRESFGIEAQEALRRQGNALTKNQSGAWELTDLTRGRIPGVVGPGVLVRVEVATLIQSVHLAPQLAPSQVELIAGLLARYDVSAPVLGTTLDGPRYDDLSL